MQPADTQIHRSTIVTRHSYLSGIMSDVRGGLREKTSAKILSGPIGTRLASVFTSSVRGKIYISILLGFVFWLFIRGTEVEVDEFQSASLRDRAYRLTSSVTDEDVYGPPVEYSQAAFKIPDESAIQSLLVWGDDIPQTRKIVQAGGMWLLELGKLGDSLTSCIL